MQAFEYFDTGHQGSPADPNHPIGNSIVVTRSAVNEKDPKSFASVPITNSGNTVLNHLPGSLFEALKPHLRRVYVSREQFLFQQDDPLDYVYFPETAVISEFHMLNDGRMVEVSISGKEGVIGISTLYHADRIANCVQVTQGGNVLRIESSLLRRIGKLFPELALLLHSTLATYIRQITQKAVCNMYHSIEERFCTWLLMVHDRSGKEMLKLTHEQIARTLGVYRPSVTGIALNMRKRRLIDYSRSSIAIRDRKGMEKSACGCYSELDDRMNVPQFAHSV